MPFKNFEHSPLFYESKGIGEPLILIPGFASGAWTWFCQIPELSENFRVITFDPRGIGQSKKADAETLNASLDTFVEDILQIVNNLQIEKINVLGASFGGFVAQQFALQYPEKVNKLILACTSAGGKNHVKPDAEILRSYTPNPKFTSGEQIRHFIRPAFTEAFNREHAEVIEKVCRLREANEVSEKTYSAQLQTAFSFAIEENLGEIKHETLVITGDQDNLVPMPNSINLAKKLPNAELKIIKDGSHMFFIENACEFNKIVSGFVNREP